MTTENPVALVFGHGVSALAVLRALGRGGVETLVAGPTNDLVRRSRYYRPAPGTIADTATPERLAAYLEQLPCARTVLFPCTDGWAVLLASLPARVADAHRAVVAPRSALDVLVDKAQFGDVTAIHGVPAPRTFRVRVAHDLDALSDEELRTSFLKPVDSQAFCLRFGVKAFPLTSRAEGAERLADVARAGLEVVVQEYIPGPPANHVFLDGFVDRAGEMRACLARKRLRMFPPPFGNSTFSETTPLAETGSAPEALGRLFRAIGFHGLFDAEFKLDERDDEYKLIEVNGRPWWQLAIAGAAGLDLVMAAYQDLAGLPPVPLGEYRVGTQWVHPVPDICALWDARRRGRPLGPSPARAWAGAANAVFAADDPLPLIAELSKAMRGVARMIWPRTAPAPPPQPARARQRPPAATTASRGSRRP
jgi:predicted ATP-grasp superfamily ATP-dependent carboligase